jgi:hypothetical protein
VSDCSGLAGPECHIYWTSGLRQVGRPFPATVPRSGQQVAAAEGANVCPNSSTRYASPNFPSRCGLGARSAWSNKRSARSSDVAVAEAEPFTARPVPQARLPQRLQLRCLLRSLRVRWLAPGPLPHSQSVGARPHGSSQRGSRHRGTDRRRRYQGGGLGPSIAVPGAPLDVEGCTPGSLGHRSCGC